MKRISRGLFKGRDEAELRRLIDRPPLDRVWSAAEDELRVVLRRAEDDGGLKYGALGRWSVTPYVIEAAMLARLGGNTDALGYVLRCIRTVVDLHADPAATAKKESLPSHSYAELALALDICAEQVPDEGFNELMEVFRRHGIDTCYPLDRFLNYAAGQNTPVAQTLNAGVAALLWGEECGHPTWRDVVALARDVLLLFLEHGVDPDGYGYEGTAYSHATFHHVYLFAELLRANGWCDLFAEEPVLSRIPVASASLLFPDRSAMINTNDHGLMWPFAMPWLLLTARHYRRPADLGLWHEFQGPDHPRRPLGNQMLWARRELPVAASTSEENYHVMPYAAAIAWWDPTLKSLALAGAGLPLSACSPVGGNANFRTSWGVDAIYVNIAGAGRSHASPGHAHADCGHFSIFAHGEYLAIDTGRYNTDEDQHNVMLIDGKCHRPSNGWTASRRAGHLRQYESLPWLDYVMTDSAHIKDCIWADRHLLFIRTGGDDAYLVTIDNVNADDSMHSFWWQLQTQSAHRLTIFGAREARLEAPKARLDMSFIIPSPEDNPTCPHTLALRTDIKEWGYGSPPFGTDVDAPLMRTSPSRPRLIAELKGVNGLMMAVVIPRRAGAAPLRVREIPAQRTLCAEVAWEGGTDTIVAALDHGHIDLPGISGRSELAVIRRGPAGHVRSTWTVNGKELNIQHTTCNT